MARDNGGLKTRRRMGWRIAFAVFVGAATLGTAVNARADAIGEATLEARRDLDKTVSGRHTALLGRPKNGDYYPVVSVIDGYEIKSVKPLKADSREPKAKHYEVSIEFKVTGDWNAEIGKETFRAGKRVDRVKVILGKSGSSSAWMKKLSHPYVKPSAVGRWVSSQDPSLKNPAP